jgi:hypothetical protein
MTRWKIRTHDLSRVSGQSLGGPNCDLWREVDWGRLDDLKRMSRSQLGIRSGLTSGTTTDAGIGRALSPTLRFTIALRSIGLETEAQLDYRGEERSICIVGSLT